MGEASVRLLQWVLRVGEGVGQAWLEAKQGTPYTGLHSRD
jgi:hypothetical protein